MLLVQRSRSKSTAWDMALVYTKNNKGSRMVLCGTPCGKSADREDLL